MLQTFAFGEYFECQKLLTKSRHRIAIRLRTLLFIFVQLEFKLKSTDEEERFGSVFLLARMFSEKDSTLAVNHKQLWTAFLGR